MNIKELEAELPNGLHDALLRSYALDQNEHRVEFVVDVWIGDLDSSVPSERERQRPARLDLLGLAYLVFEDPDPRYPATNAPVQIDTCGADENPDFARQVPKGGFAGRFFVTEWNAFIHFAALEARLTWLASS